MGVPFGRAKQPATCPCCCFPRPKVRASKGNSTCTRPGCSPDGCLLRGAALPRLSLLLFIVLIHRQRVVIIMFTHRPLTPKSTVGTALRRIATPFLGRHCQPTGWSRVDIHGHMLHEKENPLAVNTRPASITLLRRTSIFLDGCNKTSQPTISLNGQLAWRGLVLPPNSFSCMMNARRTACLPLSWESILRSFCLCSNVHHRAYVSFRQMRDCCQWTIAVDKGQY